MFGWLRRRFRNTYTGPTKRVGVDFIEFGYGYGGNVDNRALYSSAVWACVNKIASRVGVAEFQVHRWERAKRMWRPLPHHEINNVLRSPSPRLPPYLFYRTLAEHVLVEGNGYAVAGRRNSAGHPLYLMLANPWSVRINQADGQRRGLMTPHLRYDGTLSTPGGDQTYWTRMGHNVVHVRGPYYDISTGRAVSPVRYAAARSIELLETSMESATSHMRNAARFSATFETVVAGADNAETEAYMEQLRDIVAKGGKGQVPVLPHGIKYSPIQAVQADMQLAADLNWTVQDIARVYGVPLALIQHTGGQRPDIEQLEDGLLRDAVWPILHAVSAAATNCCLTADERMRGLAVRPSIMAGGPTQSGQAAMAMTLGQTGAVTINEMRAVVGLPPMDGGDDLPQTAGAGEREAPGGGTGEPDGADDSDSDTEEMDDEQDTDGD